MLSDGLASCLGNKQASRRWRPIGSRALVLAVLGGHVGIAGADVLVAGGREVPGGKQPQCLQAGSKCCTP